MNNTLSKNALHKQEVKLMGNRFELSVLSDNPEWAYECIAGAIKEIQRIEKLLTTYDSNSQTNQINTNAGVKSTMVDKEVFDLIERSIRISNLTQGAFDITYGSIDKDLWNFNTSMTSLPNPKVARRSVKLIDYKNIILERSTNSVFLKEKGMRIGFGGIGKGYAAEKAKQYLISKGVQSGIVNAAGDLVTWGTQQNGKPYTIGIASPDVRMRPFSYLNISNMAVATSGDYEKFAMINGKRFSHTINPKTGMPVSGIKSITIICPNAELADAMTTPVMVMGVKAGLDMINQIKQMACIIINDDDQVLTSKNLNLR